MPTPECRSCPMKLYGSVTVNAKGQIVIPKEVREKLSIREGETLMVMTKGDIAIGLIKSDDLPELMKYMEGEMRT